MGGTIANVATGQGSGAVTYTSANARIATVDAGGTVTGVAAGAVTISAAIAADGTYASATATYSVDVDDEADENQPVSAITDADAAANEIDENAAVGTAVGITAQATDPDDGDVVTYELSNDAGGLFGIDAQTGVVSLAQSGLDYGVATSHAITVAATSSDGSNSRADFTIEVVDIDIPVLSIVFPPEGAAFTGDTITVKGTLAAATYVGVSVDGGTVVTATVEDDQWIARDVPIVNGGDGPEVTISASAQSAGMELQATRTLTTNVQAANVGAVAFDEIRGQLIVVDGSSDRLIRINENGTQTVLSGAGVGEGVDLRAIVGLAFDQANDRVLLTDSELRAVIGVDIDTGDRTEISSATVGTGEALQSPAGLAVRGSTVVLVDRSLDAVVEVDSAGNRTILSRAGSRGTGEAFDSPDAITVHPNDASRAYVADSARDLLFEVDLDSGDRIVASANNTNPPVNQLGDVVQMPLVDDGRLFIIDGVGDSVMFVSQPEGGSRVKFSGGDSGSGPAPVALAGIAFSQDGVVFGGGRRQMVAPDSTLDRIFAIDPDGRRYVLPGNGVGEGRLFRSVTGPIEFSPAANRLYFHDPSSVTISSHPDTNALRINPAILGMDARNGNRQMLDATSSSSLFALGIEDLQVDAATGRVFVTNIEGVLELVQDELLYRSAVLANGDQIGAGIAFQRAHSFFYDSQQDVSYVLDTSLGLIEVDMASGDRTRLAEPSSTFGFNFDSELIVVDDEDRHFAVVISDHASASELFAVDLNTGTYSSFASASQGSGPELSFVSDVSLDRANNRILATAYLVNDGGTGTKRSLISIDLDSQNRAIVSSSALPGSTSGGRGKGQDFTSPYSLTIDRQNQIAYVTDWGLSAVFAVELESGDRVIMAK